MLVLSWTVYESMIERATSESPEEACGILAGVRDDRRYVRRLYETENVATDPRVTYRIDPEEQYRVMEEAEREGLDVLGFYHSHPRGPAGPSRTDRDRATWKGYHYLIVSLAGRVPTVDAWEWTGDGFRPAPLSVAQIESRKPAESGDKDRI
ncbi:MAG: desampylase [Halodesulfurarchaeum sp.]